MDLKIIMMVSAVSWSFGLTSHHLSSISGGRIQSSHDKGCPVAECAVDLGPNCQGILDKLSFH